jgi:hypothetical protein
MFSAVLLANVNCHSCSGENKDESETCMLHVRREEED